MEKPLDSAGASRPRRPDPLTVTPEAATQIAQLLAKRTPSALGVRIGLKTRGCAGLAYHLSYVDHPVDGDEKITTPGGNIYIETEALLFLVGTVMDYQDNPIAPGFQFLNPNAKGQCGCGESFHV